MSGNIWKYKLEDVWFRACRAHERAQEESLCPIGWAFPAWSNAFSKVPDDNTLLTLEVSVNMGSAFQKKESVSATVERSIWVRQKKPFQLYPKTQHHKWVSMKTQDIENLLIPRFYKVREIRFELVSLLKHGNNVSTVAWILCIKLNLFYIPCAMDWKALNIYIFGWIKCIKLTYQPLQIQPYKLEMGARSSTRYKTCNADLAKQFCGIWVSSSANQHMVLLNPTRHAS